MAQYTLDLGMKVDLLTKGELDRSLTAAMDSWRQRAAGTDYITRISLGVDAATAIVEGPLQGYAWSVKMISAALSAAGIFTVWWDAAMTLPAAEPAASGTSANITWGSDSLCLKPGRVLYVSTSAGTITSMLIGAWQIPAERLGLIR
jgi:hypothetical protein